MTTELGKQTPKNKESTIINLPIPKHKMNKRGNRECCFIKKYLFESCALKTWDKKEKKKN